MENNKREVFHFLESTEAFIDSCSGNKMFRNVIVTRELISPSDITIEKEINYHIKIQKLKKDLGLTDKDIFDLLKSKYL